ncbi:Formin-like protein [Quillaja saponaria]|uniref:Formin-like protein n=1 Tax=Quillaja saponaria TaxID=32244 RepID=A0AAD7VEX6_QUISA|nr:Formin-like protein [Quillaja saponaria]
MKQKGNRFITRKLIDVLMIFCRNNMGYGSKILLMIFFIMILFMLLSLQSTHILIADNLSNAAKDIRIHGIQQMYFMKGSGYGIENQIEKVSGKDERNEASVVQKIRALLGLKSFHIRRPPTGDFPYVSPSPAPSPNIESEAPAPVLVTHIYAHPHPSPHHSHRIPQLHKAQHEDKERVKRVLVPVLVSAGVTIVISVLALFWVCKKFGNQRKKPNRPMLLYGKKGDTRGESKFVPAQNSACKVSSNSGLDHFYLDSLVDIELHASGDVNTLSNHSSPKCMLYEREEANQEVIISEFENASSSSTKEIMYVHEDVESIKYDSDGNDSPIESHSSDDESFHSLVNSHSSNVRLSNASAGSLSETSDILSPQMSKPKPSLANSTDLPVTLTNHDQCTAKISISHMQTTQSPSNPKQEELKVERSSDCQRKMRPPPSPPPPPPPPPHHMTLCPSNSLCYPSRVTSKASCSSTKPNLLSPRNSYSSSGSNRSTESELPASPVHNTTESLSRIPSPPCPPPFLTGNNYSLKTPPPPPSQLPHFIPLGKDGAPLPKLKPLHWDKVRSAPDRSMVWDKLRSSSFELDEEMMESLFGYNLQNSIKIDEAKSKSPSPSKHVLEPKRLQNITILSKALNVTAEQVCEALIQGDGLSLQQLEALVKMVPTKEEEAKLSSYKGNINELGSAEKFVRKILDVPFAFLRIEAMLYKETFEDEVVHLKNSFSMLEEACKELRSSRLFLKLLETVLKTGNRMNVGTIRGGARAFKLDTLLKLSDVKGTDGKTTLLHFVVQEIIRAEGIRASDSIMGRITQINKNRTVEEKEEDYRNMGLDLVCGLSTELYNAKKTATIDLDVLASSVSNLSDGKAKLHHLIYKQLHVNEKSGEFVNTMKSFIDYADKNLKDLQEDEDKVISRVKEITEYFHGDVSKEEANPLRIFVIVRDFLGMLDNVCKELRRSKVPRSPNPLAPF